MELFPAADEDAWSLIKEVINDCDYYVLILAGKYGSTDARGIGYTEMEFDYAVTVGKPVLVFLHESIDTLPAANTEKSEVMQQKLSAFRDKAKSRHCKLWSGSDDLGGKVSRGIVQLRKRHPAAGWIPGKFAASTALLTEVAELRAKLAGYELELAVGGSSPPPGTDQLQQGDDQMSLQVSGFGDPNKERKTIHVKTSWDSLFSYCGPSMMNECTDVELIKKVQLLAFHHLNAEDKKHNKTTEAIIIPYVIQDEVRIQLQALGLIAPGIKRRAVSDEERYWRLTPYGERYLLKLKAIKRPAIKQTQTEESA